MLSNLFSHPIRIACLAVLLGSSAMAQGRSTGNLYFAERSVSVAEGTSRVLELMTYSGPRSFGLVQFQLDYDAFELDVESIEVGNDLRLQDYCAAYLVDGSDRCILMSQQDQFDLVMGELSLARIVVAPELPAGSTIYVELMVTAMEQRNGQDYPISLAYPLEITVTSPTSGPQGDSDSTDDDVEPPLVQATPAEWKRIRKLYPLGGIVRIMRREWRGGAFVAWPVRVDTSQGLPKRDAE